MLQRNTERSIRKVSTTKTSNTSQEAAPKPRASAPKRSCGRMSAVSPVTDPTVPLRRTRRNQSSQKKSFRSFKRNIFRNFDASIDDCRLLRNSPFLKKTYKTKTDPYLRSFTVNNSVILVRFFCTNKCYLQLCSMYKKKTVHKECFKVTIMSQAKSLCMQGLNIWPIFSRMQFIKFLKNNQHLAFIQIDKLLIQSDLRNWNYLFYNICSVSIWIKLVCVCIKQYNNK